MEYLHKSVDLATMVHVKGLLSIQDVNSFTIQNIQENMQNNNLETRDVS